VAPALASNKQLNESAPALVSLFSSWWSPRGFPGCGVK
jgi:hypothetical protein